MVRAMDWAELPYFLAVARAGSLRAAAEHVGGTHATVDRHLKSLEASFGVRLFERTRAGLALTTAGEALVPLAEAAETSVIAARRRLSGLDREAAGTVRVSIPPAMAYDLLAPLLADFCALYPDIELEIMVTDLFQNVSRNETDVSVRVAHNVSDDVVGRRVLQYATAIYASKPYLDRNLPNAGPQGEGLIWTGWGPKTPVPDWLRESPFPKAKLRHVVSEAMLQIEMVRLGMGMSYLPCYVEAYYPDLIRVPGTQAQLDRSIWLLLHADMQRTTRVRLFVDYLAARLREMRPIFLGPLADH
jgi:DNA-binding transcriptional LysR family regulator